MEKRVNDIEADKTCLEFLEVICKVPTKNKTGF